MVRYELATCISYPPMQPTEPLASRLHVQSVPPTDTARLPSNDGWRTGVALELGCNPCHTPRPQHQTELSLRSAHVVQPAADRPVTQVVGGVGFGVGVGVG